MIKSSLNFNGLTGSTLGERGVVSLGRLRPEETAEAPSTRIRLLFEKEDFFYGLASRLNVSSENGHRKCILSKAHFREEIFENAATSRRTKTEVFESSM